MAMLTLASWTTGILAFLFVLVCLLMALVILIQKPKGGGLAGAFGGAGSSAAVFGAKTGDVLTWFTVGTFALFILLSIALVYSVRADSEAEPTLPTIQVPATDTTPVAPGAPPVAPSGTAPAPAPAPAAPSGATPSPAAPATPTTPAAETPAAPAAPAPAPATPAPAPKQ